MGTEAKVTWIEDKRFVGQASSGHGIVVDASADKIGPSPMELLLIGMAGCTGHDVIEILRKQRQQVTGLEIGVRAERAEKPPRVYTTIEVEYVVRGHDLSSACVERAIKLSEEKYCSASIMLGATAHITSTYRIQEPS
jgi:putative redox protein